MKTYFLLLAISFVLFLVTALLISFCKRRQAQTRHGLTGMCHETGGSMCSTCNSTLQNHTRHPKNSSVKNIEVEN